MPLSPSIRFIPLEMPRQGTVVLVAGEGATFGPVGRMLNERSQDSLAAAARTASFTGKANAILDLIGPRGFELDRVLVAGIGKAQKAGAADWLKLGGTVLSKLAGTGDTVSVLLEVPGSEDPIPAGHAADFALGLQLRAYKFDRYKSQKKEDEPGKEPNSVAIAVADPAAAEKEFESRSAAAEGVVLARDLVNEPPNVLGPVEFASRAETLRDLGVEVEVLTETEMQAQGMQALLGVAQGSARPPRLVAMRWSGGGESQPVAFIGKGVVFDSGGLSIKPGQGMEDMKGDMAGAAAVVGLMRTLAGRRARANVVGIIGLVENMPDGKAQRPGDIVKAMSGTTIEIINTDAEGRLVLADALWYCRERYKPQFMVDLATLTGAIVVALGQEHAGLFSSDDELADNLIAAGQATGERVWRMPLAAEYDKMIESKVADIKNSAGRNASAVTAAQFLRRFVGDTPWAHLDVAGVAMGSPQTEINRSWSSGFGVRLLDRLVADRCES